MRLGKINFGEEVYTTEEIDQKFAALGADVDARLAGKASLEGGKVPSDELPSYVDDVEEYASLDAFPEEGEEGKIYVAKNTNKTYRWSGTQYIKIGGDDAILTPITSDTPTFSEWTFAFDPNTFPSGHEVDVVFDPGVDEVPSRWELRVDGGLTGVLPGAGDETELIFNDIREGDFDGTVTATRVRTDITGYTLGDQDDKPLAPAKNYALKSELPAVVAPSTSANAAGKAADAKATADALAGKLSKAEAEAGFTKWSLEDGATPPGLQLSDQPYIARDGDETYWAVPLVGMGDVRIGGTPADTDATSLSWHGQREGLEVSFTTTRTSLPTMADLDAKQDTISDLATIRAEAAAGATAEETLQFREWFPGGEAKSIADCTTDLKFDWDNADETNHTVEVLPFCHIGGSTKENSDKSGRVVIPPYAEKNGVRYAVVGVAVRSSGTIGVNSKLTAIVAPTSVVTIANEAFIGCTSLASVALLAATTIGDAAFYRCTSLVSVTLPASTIIGNEAFLGCASLTSMNFGPDARQSVPESNFFTYPDLSQSGHTCRIIVPDDNYDAWTTDPDWSELTSMGYEFVKWSSTQPIPRGDVEGVYAKLTDVPTAVQRAAWDAKQNAISDLNTIRSGAAAGATAYQKPSGGIPATDMVQAVQTSLQKADDALSRAEAEDGFTEWTVTPPTYNGSKLTVYWNEAQHYWELHNESGTNVVTPVAEQSGYETYIKWNDDEPLVFTATRTRLRPTAEQEAEWTHKVWEYATSSAFPQTGVENRVYVDKSTNLTYRWDAATTSYVQIGGSSVTVDDAISTTSTNPVQNQVIASALSGKANSAALAAEFSASTAYPANSYVTHDGLMYKCASSVAAGAWNASNWTQVDLMSPDATFDVLADGRLRISDSSGNELWSQGYNLASGSATTLSCDKVNYFEFEATAYEAFSESSPYSVDAVVVYSGKVYKCTTAVDTAGTWTGSANWEETLVSQEFTLPKAGNGKVGDFILDVSNANNYEVHVSLAGTLGTDYDIIVPRGESISDILTAPAGGLAELYFTMTAFGTAAKPAWKVVRQLVEKEEAQS